MRSRGAAPLAEPTAFSYGAVRWRAVPFQDEFLFMFKCLSELQTSGSCQLAVPCPSLPTSTGPRVGIWHRSPSTPAALRAERP